MAVVAWGDVEFGGDCSLVQDQLQGVQQITASSGAFAALLETGAVVTWGNPQYGSDSSKVKDQLEHVVEIHAADSAFACLRNDRSVVTWWYRRWRW